MPQENLVRLFFFHFVMLLLSIRCTERKWRQAKREVFGIFWKSALHRFCIYIYTVCAACKCEFLRTRIHPAASPLCADLIRQKWSWVTGLTELMSSFNSTKGKGGIETGTWCKQKAFTLSVICHVSKNSLTNYSLFAIYDFCIVRCSHSAKIPICSDIKNVNEVRLIIVWFKLAIKYS